MRLYKFVPTKEIAKQISDGVFRFYELVKYIKLEEDTGRSDSAEGSVSFPDDGSLDFIDKLPTGSFDGIEFQCESISFPDEYLRQYFVFCMSTEKTEAAIGDCSFAVELETDYFETFGMLLNEASTEVADEGQRFFSHDAVEYYDIDNHPASIEGKRWREVYVKHSSFGYQQEYRAALCAKDSFFERISIEPKVIERPIQDMNGQRMPFNLRFLLRSGVDESGWRYVEIDVSEFQANLVGEPNRILSFEGCSIIEADFNATS